MKGDKKFSFILIACLLSTIFYTIACDTNSADIDSHPDGDNESSQNQIYSIDGNRGDIILTVRTPAGNRSISRFELLFSDNSKKDWYASVGLETPADMTPAGAQLQLKWHSVCDIFDSSGAFDIELLLHDEAGLVESQYANSIYVDNELKANSIRLDADQPAIPSSTNPRLVSLPNQKIGMVWFDTRLGPNRLAAAILDDGDHNWSDAVFIDAEDSGSPLSLPKLVPLESDSFAAVWRQRDMAGSRIVVNGLNSSGNKILDSPLALSDSIPNDVTISSLNVTANVSRIYIVWVETTETEYAIHFASVSNGLEANPIHKILTAGAIRNGEESAATILCLDNNLHVIWRKEHDRCELIHIQSSDSGSSWQDPRVVASYDIETDEASETTSCYIRPYLFPANGNGLHLFYLAPSLTDRGILMQLFDGDYWSSAKKLTGENATPLSSLSTHLHNDGTVSLAWSDARSGGFYNIYYLAIAPDGTELIPEMPIGNIDSLETPMSYYPSIASNDNVISIIWQDILFSDRSEYLSFCRITKNGIATAPEILASGTGIRSLLNAYDIAAKTNGTIAVWHDNRMKTSTLNAVDLSSEADYELADKLPTLPETPNGSSNSPTLSVEENGKTAAWISRTQNGLHAYYTIEDGSWKSESNELPGQSITSDVRNIALAKTSEAGIAALIERDRPQGGSDIVVSFSEDKLTWSEPEILNIGDLSPLPFRNARIFHGEPDGDLITMWIDIRSGVVTLLSRDYTREEGWHSPIIINDKASPSGDPINMISFDHFIGENGRLAIGWIGEADGLYGIYIRNSESAGKNYQDKYSVVFQHPSPAIDFDMAMWGDSKSIVTFSAGESDDSRSVFVSRSIDNEENWDVVPVSVTDEKGAYFAPECLVTDEEGLIVAYWQIMPETGNMELQVAFSKSFGNDFDAPVQIDSIEGEIAYKGLLQICNSGNSIYAMYPAPSGYSWEYRLVASLDGGQSWLSPRVLLQAPALEAELYCGNNGEFHVIYGDSQSGFEEIKTTSYP